MIRRCGPGLDHGSSAGDVADSTCVGRVAASVEPAQPVEALCWTPVFGGSDAGIAIISSFRAGGAIATWPPIRTPMPTSPTRINRMPPRKVSAIGSATAPSVGRHRMGAYQNTNIANAIPHAWSAMQYGQKLFKTNSCSPINHAADPAASVANGNKVAQARRWVRGERRGPMQNSSPNKPK